MWDIVLALRLGKYRLPIVYGLATDDAHAYHVMGGGKANPGRGWIMVRARHLTAEAIVRGMEAGDFYASTGVVLDDVRRDGDEIRSTIQPEKGVTYRRSSSPRCGTPRSIPSRARTRTASRCR